MINSCRLFERDRLLVIAGPCALENDRVVFETAEHIKKLQERFKEIQFIFSGSFDKANRTKLDSKRGPGIDKGLSFLKQVKLDYGLPLLTDVHLPEQVMPSAEVCDVLQIPAFLCRQTDLLVEAAKHAEVVNVKKGQFLSPFDLKFSVEKLEQSGAKEIWQTERGTSFGYGSLVVDMRSIAIMKENCWPSIFDVTHSLQMPGSGNGVTGGDRRFAMPLTMAALAAGAEGLYIEAHPKPENAISDSATQLPLTEIEGFLEKCLRVWSVGRSNT